MIEDGPNAIIWTHADQVNQALIDSSHDQRTRVSAIRIEAR